MREKTEGQEAGLARLESGAWFTEEQGEARRGWADVNYEDYARPPCLVPVWLGLEAGNSSWSLSTAAAPQSTPAPARPPPPSMTADPVCPEVPTACPGLGAHWVARAWPKALGEGWWERLPGGPTMPVGQGGRKGGFWKKQELARPRRRAEGQSLSKGWQWGSAQGGTGHLETRMRWEPPGQPQGSPVFGLGLDK